MKVYTVHEPPAELSETDETRLDRITFVKEGFCWPALFIPTFWLLWHRMWWVLLAWLAIGVGIGVIGELVDDLDFILGVVSVVFALWFALEANALRRWSLGQKGWRMLGVAAGRNREEAEQSFFRRYLAGEDGLRSGRTGGNRPASGHVPTRTFPAPRPQPPAGTQPVIGLFPQP
jgi:hypothetical protein